MLVSGWVKKNAYCYNLWINRESPVELFSDEEHEGFIEDEDWLDWATALEVDHPAFDEIVTLRLLRPVL